MPELIDVVVENVPGVEDTLECEVYTTPVDESAEYLSCVRLWVDSASAVSSRIIKVLFNRPLGQVSPANFAVIGATGSWTINSAVANGDTCLLSLDQDLTPGPYTVACAGIRSIEDYRLAPPGTVGFWYGPITQDRISRGAKNPI